MNEDLIRLGLVDDDEIDLADAALILALLDHPGTDLDPYHAVLDAIGERVETVGATAETPEEHADVLAEVLAGDFGFAGDTQTYDHPDNADLIRVLDRRRGLPVSLSILWVAAARHVGWDAELLDVPGHVLVLIGAEADPVIVDPFAGGARVDAARLQTLVQTFGEPGRAVTHIAAMASRAVLVRLLQNQASRAEQAGQGRRALELYTRMTVLAPTTVHAWWERARLELLDANVPAARASLGAILEVTREPGLRQRVTQMLASL